MEGDRKCVDPHRIFICVFHLLRENGVFLGDDGEGPGSPGGEVGMG